MKFKDEATAKRYVFNRMVRAQTPQEAEQRLRDFERYRDNASDPEERANWKRMADGQRAWLEDPDFKEGCYAQGIDHEFLELVEWRAQINAFVETQTNAAPFVHHDFFRRWMIGANYAVFSLLGKLFSKSKRDTSLVNLWKEGQPYLKDDRTFFCKEVRRLNSLLSDPKSEAIRVRNTVVSHNRAQPRIGWSVVDRDIHVLARAWFVLNVWAGGLPILEPFPGEGTVFNGLEPFFSVAERQALKSHRREYIDAVEVACRRNRETKELDPRRPFGRISISMAGAAPQP